MCKYYGKTDFGGCYHSVKTEDIPQHLHFRKEYCSHYIHQWAKAMIKDDTTVLGPDDTINPVFLACDSTRITAGRVQPTLAPCPYRTYDMSAAVLASQEMSAVPAARSIGPVCPACGEKALELDREWDMFKLLIENFNVNIGHELYSGPYRLRNDREVPRYLQIMIPMTEERLQRMDDRRNMAFASSGDENVFVSQQWDSLRFFQRVVFYEYVRRRSMPAWSTHITMFDRKVNADAWTRLNSQLCVFFVAQNMDHALPSSSGSRPARIEAKIDLDYAVPALASPRGAAELAGWADLHTRVRAEDAVMSTDINVFSLFSPSVSSVLEELNPNPEAGLVEEASVELADCIRGSDVFLGVEE
ncbi:hypothetical protein F503_06000 [Ophiostoma piceae UAMH 11346]|uniref:Uncharacterized protein n=1 Tax=Ophiostoma piceae (strain UAMH 11346) TaxID=1262450 RepID=S3DBF9_OPHP1|nr:hypothetical protein F503_06000 [Ophiostoma piceae UAMH 11346]